VNCAATEEDIGQETLRRVGMMPRFAAWLAGEIERYLGERMLEVGCGIGTLTEHFVRASRQVVACDIREDYLALVRERWSAMGVETALWDVQEPAGPALSATSFDSVACLNVLEHVERDEDAIRNMMALLKRDGRLILFVPALPWLYGGLDAALGHRRRYRKRTLCERMEALGCTVRRASYVNLSGIVGWFLNGRVLKRTILPMGQLRVYDRLVPVMRIVERVTGPPIGQSLLLVGGKGDS
jgi:SAM-dependent methyltransferase